MSHSSLSRKGLPRSRAVPLASGLLTIGLVTGCAGSITATDAPQEKGEGFEFGADQGVVNAAVEELEPVTLKYQAPVAPPALTARPAEVFKEYVEERSNGKITIDVVWGPTVATFDEVDDALMDGRLDMATTIPSYDAQSYPKFNALSAATGVTPTGPIAGEISTLAAMAAFIMNDDEVVNEFEEKGLTLLKPMILTGQAHFWCNDEAPEASDWKGHSISVSNTAYAHMVDLIDANPVTLSFTEQYEGLQRNTVNCVSASWNTGATGGLAAVAPYVHTADSGGMMRSATTIVAGSSFADLPLAYQQILFDSEVLTMGEDIDVFMENAAVSVAEVAENGGEFIPLDRKTDSTVGQATDDVLSGYIEEGILSQDNIDEIEELSSSWADIAAEHGIVDSGEMNDFDDWFVREDFDLEPFIERLFTEHFTASRPA